MKKILFLLVVLFVSCKNRQTESVSLSSDSTFLEIIQLSSKNMSLSDTMQKSADKQTSKVINKAAETITTLKVENGKLKKELNEVTKKLDDITNSNNGVQFKLLPVSDGKENRQ